MTVQYRIYSNPVGSMVYIGNKLVKVFIIANIQATAW